MTDVVYKSGTHPTQGWDVMQVICKSEGNIVNSFVVALAVDGTILRKTDIVLDWWETITDENDQRFLRSLFNDRDKRLMEDSEKGTAAAG